jgi:hypothetical protein
METNQNSSEKSCKKCKESTSKFLAPMTIYAIIFVSFAIYGIVKFIGNIINLFTQ